MLAYSLFSGSDGNSAYVAEGDDAILIDCGRSAAAIRRAIEGESLTFDFKAIFITHEHTDHISALAVIAKRTDAPIYAAPLVCRALSGMPYSDRLIPLPREGTVEVGRLSLSSVPLPHDSAANVGYIIKSSDGDTLGIATDMGKVPPSLTEKLSGCRSVMIESNHDVAMLMAGPYPLRLKERILSQRGHLSNDDCAALSVTLASAGVENITLAHLSRENNTPQAAYDRTVRALSESGKCGVRLRVAGQTVRIN